MEREMCNYLDWELTVDDPILTNFEQAVKAAEEGAKSTGGMKAKFGRATYVGDKADVGDAPPDPGAMAAFYFLEGFLKGYA